MKRISFGLTVCLILLLAACNGDLPTNVPASQIEGETAVPPTPSAAVPPTATAATAATEPTAVPNPTPVPLPDDCDQPLCFEQTVNLLQLQNQPVSDNVVKLFSAAADPDRNLVYVSGIMSQYIAVLDETTEEWVDTIDSGVPVGTLKYLYLDPVANYLYILNATSAQLSRIDLNNGERVGPVSLGERSVAHHILVDSARTRLYLTTGAEPGFRAFDGRTLEQIFTNDTMGMDTGQMAANAAAAEIYVLGSFNQEAQRRIYVLDPDSGQVTDEILYDYPFPGRVSYLFYDPASQNFLVGGFRQVVLLNRQGETLSSFPLQRQGEMQDMAYDPATQTLHVLSLERPSDGQVAADGGLLQAYDLNGQVTAQLDFGRKTHRLVLNPANGRLYIPNGDASTVWRIDSRTYAEAVPLRLGDSVEGIVFSPDGRTLYVNSRLGGSYLAAYDLETGDFESFNAGYWPIPIRADADNQRLFVLNAWDSTLDVYAIGDGRQPVGTIPLGLPPGSTDRLPDLAIDTSHHRAYAAYPEFGQVAVVNWETMTPVTTITLDNFRAGDTGGGPGQLQVSVNEASNRLFVYRAQEALLDVYDGNANYALIDQVALPQMRDVSLTADMLFFDAGTNKLFIGPLELDGDTGQPTGRSLPQGQQVFGLDAANNLLWVFEGDQANGTTTLAALDRDTLAVRYAQSIPADPAYLPHFALSPAGDRIAVGFLITGTVDVYRVGETAVAQPTSVPPDNTPAADAPQFGLNFIRFFWSGEGATDMSIVDTSTPYFQPDWIFNDFDALGVDAFRQFIKADLFWNVVEPQDDQWRFDEADAVIMNATAQPIVTLFSLQYASPTPPWGTEFQKTMGSEAIDYVTAVVQRYAPYVTYWEIGNEMDHWRAFDPGSDNTRQSQRQLTAVPSDGFSPEEQGAFLAEVSAIIRANDPDAVILMPGMGGLDDYTLNTWFAGVLAGGGSDWFDIVNYHFYNSWERLGFLHRDLDAFMEAHGLTDKPIWLTETGATSDPTLDGRTNYPNSPETQAADVFRRTIQAYGAGDSFVAWHTYIGSPATPNNLWRLYGIRTDTAEAQPSYYAVQLLTSELLPFASVEPVGGAGQQIYRVETAVGETKYVAWGQGTFITPDGMTQMTSVVSDAEGMFGWTAVSPGAQITLTDLPILLK